MLTEVDHDQKKKAVDLPSLVKNLYHEAPDVASISLEEVIKWRKSNMNISVNRVFAEKEEDLMKPIPKPITTFEQAFRNHPEILELIDSKELKYPWPIESQVWPIIMSGEDFIGIFLTGRGKLSAFLFPAFLHIEAQLSPHSEREGPIVLIITVTSVLACQIAREVNKYSYKGIKCVCLHNEGKYNDQIAELRKNKYEIAVATPKRLVEMILEDEISLCEVSYVVLDKFDEMVMLDFDEEIQYALMEVRTGRQMVIICSNWLRGSRKLAKEITDNPIQVVVGSPKSAPIHPVSQHIIVVDEEQKPEQLQNIMKSIEDDDKIIIFCKEKEIAENIALHFMLDDFEYQCLYEESDQKECDQAMNKLKSREVDVLIATDAVSYKLDLSLASFVLNYDFPRNIEEYLRRIRQLELNEYSCTYISLFSYIDKPQAKALIKILSDANEDIPDELEKMINSRERLWYPERYCFIFSFFTVCAIVLIPVSVFLFYIFENWDNSSQY